MWEKKINFLLKKSCDNGEKFCVGATSNYRFTPHPHFTPSSSMPNGLFHYTLMPSPRSLSLFISEVYFNQFFQHIQKKKVSFCRERATFKSLSRSYLVIKLENFLLLSSPLLLLVCPSLNDSHARTCCKVGGGGIMMYLFFGDFQFKIKTLSLSLSCFENCLEK